MTIKITQTDYIDFLGKSGVPKYSKVKSIFNRPSYNPAFDFYKAIREEFVDYIKYGKSKADLYSFFIGQSAKKQSRFEPLVKGFLKFLGRKKVTWFPPPTEHWGYKQLSIKMNPEIGVVLDDEPFIVKLYFKDVKLNKSDIRVLLEMMESTLPTGVYTGFKCALLDVERNKLHFLKKAEPSITPLIEGEAESFIRMWQELEKKSA